MHRVQNAISTASVTLRNPGKKWTGGLGNNKLQAFTPMDKITIFLERIPNTPIQVFTGFLDTTPLYQMYPGVVTLEASCTLKRLMYTYWDPALPFVYEFLAQYGWISDGNGNLTNYTSVAQGSDTILSYESQAAQDVANAQGQVKVQVSAEPPKGTSGSVQMLYGDSATNLNKQSASVNFVDFIPGVSAPVSLELTGLDLNKTYYYQAYFAYTSGTGPATAKVLSYKTGGATSPPAFQINDSSLSNLLYAVLEDIAGWADSTVFIESLPNDIVQKLLVLYENLAENESVTLQQLQGFLGQIIGTGSQGSGLNNNVGGGVPGQIPGGSSFTQQTWSIGFLNGLGVSVTTSNVQAIMAWVAQEGGNWNNTATYNPLNTTQTEPGSKSAGLQQPDIQAYTSWQSGFKATITTLTSSDYGYPAVINALKAGNNATAVVTAIGNSKWGTDGQRLLATLASTPTVIIPNNTTSPLNPYGTSIGSDPAGANAVSVKTKSATHKGGNASDPSTSSTSGYSKPLKDMPTTFNVTNSQYGGLDQGVILLTGKMGDPVYAIAPGIFSYGGTKNSKYVYHGPNGNDYGDSYPIITVSDGPWKGRSVFYGFVQGNPPQKGNAVKAGEQIGTIAYHGTTQSSGMGLVDIGFLSGGPTTPPYPWAPGDAATPDAETMFKNMQQLVNGNSLTPSSAAAVTGLANSQNTPNTVADVQSLSVSAAFNTLFNFPSIENTETALLLTGDKSYMNDQSIFPFIQQLTQGCLRSFQSMPNGNLFVYFPDYFGGWSHRTPYWQIDDIEILDGTIQVSDAALATHVFVSGDTIVADAGTVSPFDQVASTGVVSLNNAGISNFIKRSKQVNDKSNKTVGTNAGSILGDDSQILSTPTDIAKFLQRYGVRPLVDNEPLIHSHYFELFMAYQLFQLMWARQYLSTFTFTFMPELYPGGIVTFPSHGINMYVDEVIHTFDYESGFLTQANLMAPSAASANDSIPFTNGLVVFGTGVSSNPGGAPGT